VPVKALHFKSCHSMDCRKALDLQSIHSLSA
jgi:hypothetical protein